MCLPIVESTTLGKKTQGCQTVRSTSDGAALSERKAMGRMTLSLTAVAFPILLYKKHIYATDVLPPNQSEYILTLSKLRVNQAYISSD